LIDGILTWLSGKLPRHEETAAEEGQVDVSPDRRDDSLVVRKIASRDCGPTF